MKPITVTICSSILIASCFLGIGTAESICKSEYPPRVGYMVLASEASAQYGVPERMIKTIIQKESGWKADAVGDRGKAYGLAQYHENEFDRYEALYRKATGKSLDYHNPNDQITLMAWQFATYPKSRRDWSTYRRTYMRK